MQRRNKVFTVLALALLGAATAVQAQDEQVTRMRAALASPERSADNKARTPSSSAP